MGKVSQTFEFNFKFNDNNASKQLKAISNDVKNMLSEMGNASDKMSIFKEMVSYLDQVDRAMSAFKAKNKNAFDQMFGNLDSVLVKELEKVFGVLNTDMANFGGLKQRIQDAMDSKPKLEVLRKIAEDVNNLFDSMGKTKPINIDEMFTGKGSKSAGTDFESRIHVLNNALDNFAANFQCVQDKLKNGLQIGTNGSGMEMALDGQIKSLEKQIDDYKNLILVFKKINDAKSALDSDNGTQLSDDFIVDYDVESIKNLIKTFRSANDEIQLLAKEGKTASVEYYKAMATAAKSAISLQDVDYNMEKELEEALSSTKIGSGTLQGTFDTVLSEAENFFNDGFDQFIENIHSRINIAIKDTIAKISRLQSGIDGITDGVGSKVGENEVGNQILKIGEHAIDATEYIHGMTLAIKEMFDVLSKASDTEYKALLGGQNLAIKQAQIREVSRQTTAEAYLANIMQDTDLDAHSHQGLAANIDAPDFEQAIWRQYAGIAKMSAIIGDKDIVTLDLAKVKAEDAYTALAKLKELIAQRGTGSVGTSDLNKILQSINPEYTNVAQRWDPSRFGDLAAHIFEIKQSAQMAFDPVQRLQNILVAMSGKQIDFSKYEDLLSALTKDNVGEIFNRIAKSENIMEDGKVLQVEDISTATASDVAEMFQMQKEKLIEYREAAKVTYAEIKQAVEDFSKVYTKNNVQDFDFFKKWFSADEAKEIQKMFMELEDGFRDLNGIVDQLAFEGFGIDPRENGDLEERLELLRDIGYEYGSTVTQKDRNRLEKLEDKSIDAELTSKEEESLSELSEKIQEADENMARLSETYDKIILKLENGKKIEILPDDKGLRNLDKIANEFGDGEFNGQEIQDIIFIRNQEVETIESVVAARKRNADAINIENDQLQELHGNIEATNSVNIGVAQEKLKAFNDTLEEAKSKWMLDTFSDVELVAYAERLGAARQELQAFADQGAITADEMNRVNEEFDNINSKLKQTAQYNEEDRRAHGGYYMYSYESEYERAENENQDLRSENDDLKVENENLKNKLHDQAQTEESSKEITQYQDLLTTINQVKQAVDEKTSAFREEASTVDTVVNDEISSLSRLEGAIKNIGQALDEAFAGTNSIADNVKDIVYHAGDLSNIGNTLKTLPLGNFKPVQMDSAFNGFTGLYTTENFAHLSGNEWEGAPISTIDLSQYKMFDARSDELATKAKEFFNDLNGVIYGYITAFDFDVDDIVQLKNNKTVEDLYESFKQVFSNVQMDMKTFRDFIERAQKVVQGHAFNEVDMPDIDQGVSKFGAGTTLQNVAREVLNADTFQTQLLKMLGFEGIDLRGTKYNSAYTGGTVIFDIKPESMKSVNEKWTDVARRNYPENDFWYSPEALAREEKRRQLAFETAQAYSKQADNMKEVTAQEKAQVVADVSDESIQHQNLLGIVDKVIEAVNEKTSAFQNEASVVNQTVQQEISSLNTLKALLDEIKNSLQIVFNGNTKDFGEINFGQDKINGETAANILQSINATLSSIYGTLQGFTGVKADNENSAQYKPVNQEHQTGVQSLNDSAQALSSAADEIKQAQQDELVAMHGLSTKNLIKALEDGAFPAPSIAVTKPDVYSGGYGDATVVFKKSAIDPAANPANKIYGVDAYTPTYPSFGYELDEKGLTEASKRTGIAVDILRNACDNAYEDIKQAAEKLAYTAGLGTQFEEAFVKERGFNINAAEIDEPTQGRFHVDGENIQNTVRDIIAREGITFDDVIRNSDVKKEYFDAIDKYVSDYNSQFEDFPQAKIKDVVVSAFKDRLNAALSDKAIYDEEKAIFDHDQAVVRGELKKVDEGARLGEIHRLVNENQSEYLAYVEDVLKSAMVKPNVRGANGQRFDRTAEGIAAAMSSYGGKNALYDKDPFMRRDMDDQLFIIGAAKNYKNWDEIKADSDRLQKDAEGTHTKLDNGYIQGIARSIAKENNIDSQDAFDKIAQAVDGNTTAEAIGKALKSSGLTVNDDTIKKLAISAQEAANVNTKYFEAKPQRALGLDDIEFVSVPKGATQLMSMLDGKGIKYVQHDASDDLSRESALREGMQKFGEADAASANERLQIEQKITAEKKQQESLENKDASGATDSQREVTEMQQLATQVGAVEDAVKSKTAAFTQEGIVVNQVITQEIAALQNLINKLNEVKDAVNGKTQAFKNEGGAVKEAAGQQGKQKRPTRKTPRQYKQTAEFSENNLRLSAMRNNANKGFNKTGIDPANADKLSGQQKEIYDQYVELLDVVGKLKTHAADATQDQIQHAQDLYNALMQNVDAYNQQQEAIKNLQQKPGQQGSKKSYGTATIVGALGRDNNLNKLIADSDLTTTSLTPGNELYSALEKYKTSYAELEKIYNRLKSVQNPTMQDEAAFKAASAACNQNRKAVEDLVKARNKLYENNTNIQPLDSGFTDTDKGRTKALTDYVESMYGSTAKIDQFKNSFNEVEFTIRNADGTFTKAKASVDAFGKAIVESANNSQSASRQFGSLGDVVKEFGQELAQFVVTRFGIEEVVQAISRGVDAVRELDLAMTELKKVTDETDATYNNFLGKASKTAGSIGTTLTEFVSSTADFARLGYDISEAASLAEAASIYSNIGDGVDDIEQGTNSIISTMQAFGMEASDAMSIVDKFNEIGNKFAITSGGIGDALQVSASALYAAGNTIDESIALITTANSVVQNPNVVGTALKTLSLRLRGAKVELEEAGLETEAMAESTATLQAKLKALTHGKVDIMADPDTFKNTTQILREMATAWEEMTDIERAERCPYVQKCA